MKIGTTALVKIGSLKGSCKQIRVDPQKNEYITKLTLRYGASFIDAIAIEASTGARIF